MKDTLTTIAKRYTHNPSGILPIFPPCVVFCFFVCVFFSFVRSSQWVVQVSQLARRFSFVPAALGFPGAVNSFTYST
jgi:hypothetical protein